MGQIVGPGGQPVDSKKERVIPADLLKSINEVADKRNNIFNEFMQVSLQRAGLAKKEQVLLEKIKNSGQSLTNRIENAFKKMKLKEEKNYNWRYNGEDKFVGRLRPKPVEVPKKEEKK